jgi:hypothetical protein
MTSSLTHPENRPSHPAERRLHPRVEVDCPVTVSLPDGQHAARLRDLSRAGVCLFLDRRIPEMTILGLSLELPPLPGARARRVQGRGVVVRCQALSPHVDHFEIAVFLNDLDERNRRTLEDYVALRAQ